MKRMTTRTSIIAAAAAASLLVGGGVAFAFWTSSGTGSGSAVAGDTSAVTLTAVAPPTGLYPGGPAQTVQVKVANPDANDVKLANVAVTVTGAPAGCLVDDFDVTTVDTGIVVPGNGSVTVDAATIALVNTALNQDKCKGATLDLGFEAIPAA